MEAPTSSLVNKIVKTKEQIKSFFEGLEDAKNKKEGIVREIGGKRIRIKEVS